MSHKWLIKFLRHRIADKHLLRLISKWLKAGVMEEGKIQRVSTGTPQGGLCKALHKPPYAKKCKMQSKSLQAA